MPLVCLAFALLAILPLRGVSVWGQEYTLDRPSSDELTEYLRKNRLPLVGAQVLKAPDGQKRLMLYGFVATDFGRHDAETKALAHLGITGITVQNRIAVRPEIENLKAHPHAASGSSPGRTQARDLGTSSFDQVINDIQRYGYKTPPGEEDLNGP
jgi:hypothetical protein